MVYIQYGEYYYWFSLPLLSPVQNAAAAVATWPFAIDIAIIRLILLIAPLMAGCFHAAFSPDNEGHCCNKKTYAGSRHYITLRHCCHALLPCLPLRLSAPRRRFFSLHAKAMLPPVRRHYAILRLCYVAATDAEATPHVMLPLLPHTCCYTLTATRAADIMPLRAGHYAIRRYATHIDIAAGYWPRRRDTPPEALRAATAARLFSFWYAHIHMTIHTFTLLSVHLFSLDTFIVSFTHCIFLPLAIVTLYLCASHYLRHYTYYCCHYALYIISLRQIFSLLITPYAAYIHIDTITFIIDTLLRCH